MMYAIISLPNLPYLLTLIFYSYDSFKIFMGLPTTGGADDKKKTQ